MTIEEKIEKILQSKSIDDIIFRSAGVAILFYKPPDGFKIETGKEEWRGYFTIDRYHPTFKECIDAEYEKIDAASR